MGDGVKVKEPIQFYSEGDIAGQIRGAYPLPVWTVLTSLRDGVGFDTRGQTADAFAFGTWPSRGLKIIGFEAKSYRGDWIRELRNPAKAEAFACYCDEWWIVATEEVVKIEEVPDAWGWATPTPKGLKRMKAPKESEAKNINRLFLMSIMRNVGANYTPTRELEDRIKKATDAEVESRRDSALTNLKYREEECEQLRKKIKDFEDKAGFEISNWRWSASEIGALVKHLTDGDLKWTLSNLEGAGKKLNEVLKAVRSIPFFKSDE